MRTLAIGALLLAVAAMYVPFSPAIPFRWTWPAAGVVALAIVVLRRAAKSRSEQTGAMVFCAIAALWFPAAYLFNVGVRTPHVAASATSPDGGRTAQVFVPKRFLDRNLSLRIREGWLPLPRTVYVSGDDTCERGERILWSRDGSHVLVVGRDPCVVSAEEAAGRCLVTGEAVYLHADLANRRIRSNMHGRVRAPFVDAGAFTLADLEGHGFEDVALTPGVVATDGRHACATLAES